MHYINSRSRFSAGMMNDSSAHVMKASSVMTVQREMTSVSSSTVSHPRGPHYGMNAEWKHACAYLKFNALMFHFDSILSNATRTNVQIFADQTSSSLSSSSNSQPVAIKSHNHFSLLCDMSQFTGDKGWHHQFPISSKHSPDTVYCLQHMKVTWNDL